MRIQTDTACALHADASAAEREQDGTLATLRQAHVHVSRYYRAWLARTPGGEALVEGLAVEALVRISRMPAPPSSSSEVDVVAAWLSIAHDVAREMMER